MKEEIKYIEALLERFFEGQTSNEEEQRLYRFFEKDILPDELAQYKPVIKYFQSGMADEMGMESKPELKPELRPVVQPELKPESKPESKSKSHPAAAAKRRWIVWGSVAASVLIIVFSSIFLFDLEESTDVYAGSYIIRNGVRITDLDLIKPELEAAIQKSLFIEQQADQLIEQLSVLEDDYQDVEITQRFHEHNQQILDNIQDETQRLEVEKILNENL